MKNCKKFLARTAKSIQLYQNSCVTISTCLTNKRLQIYARPASPINFRNENYDKETNGDLDWTRNTVYNLLRLYESHELQFSHLGQWYNMHVWRFFDTVYDSIGQIEVVR